MDAMRDKGEGTIYLRADSLRWTAAVTMHGKRATKACPHQHRPGERRECAESRANLVELLRLRDARAPSGGHRLTLGQYLDGWLRDVRPRLAPATYRKHESIVRVWIVPALGAVRLSELSVAQVRGFLNGAGEDRSAQTRRHHRGTLRRALADALRDGLVTRNVAALAEPPRLTVRERAYLDASQCRSLIEGTRDDRLHALWVLAVTTGMREAEMLGLEWSHVDLDGASVTVSQTLQRNDGEWQLRPTKTAKSRRSVPLPAVTVAALRAHRVSQLEERAKAGRLGDGLVFVTATGRPVHGENLTKILYAHLDRLGLPRVTVHGLRHAAATVLMAQGYPIAKVAAILGHSSSRVTEMIYGHMKGEDFRDGADVMERLYGTTP